MCLFRIPHAAPGAVADRAKIVSGRSYLPDLHWEDKPCIVKTRWPETAPSLRPVAVVEEIRARQGVIREPFTRRHDLASGTSLAGA